MTKTETARLAAALRRVSDASEVNVLTLRAVVAAIAAEFDLGSEFRFNATNVVDLSGANYLDRIGAAPKAERA